MKFWAYLIKAENRAREVAQNFKASEVNQCVGCFSWNGAGDMHPVKSILTWTKYLKILIHHMVSSAHRSNPEGLSSNKITTQNTLATLLKTPSKQEERSDELTCSIAGFKSD